jgi:hypothetical protein
MISPKVKQGRIKGEEGVERGFSLSLSPSTLRGPLSQSEGEPPHPITPPPVPMKKMKLEAVGDKPHKKYHRSRKPLDIFKKCSGLISEEISLSFDLG